MTKIHLLVKPTQSGKTFIMLEKILEMLNNDNTGPTGVSGPAGATGNIHIIFCDNQLIQTEQTNNRFNKYDNEFKSVILSSKSKTRHTELPNFILNDNIKAIIACSNKIRVNNIDKLMDFKELKDKKFTIWIDEIDKNINLFENFIKIWEQKTIVESIYLITATPSDIENKFNNINIVELEQTYNENYHSLSESKFKIVNCNENNIEMYVEKVMTKYSNLIKDDQVWFIPGDTNISSHESIKDYLLSLDFVVIIINSNGKIIYTDDKEEYLEDLCDDDMNNNEIANMLGNYYKKYILGKKKVAITGNICISRGITINSEDMLISHAIFPTKIINESTCYQLAGRICGNIKQFKNYKKPTIFCSNDFKHIILKMEDIAKKFAKNTAKNTAKDTAKKTTKKTANKTTKKTANKTANETANETIEDTVKNTSNETIEDTVKNTSNETIEDIAKNTSNETIKDTANETIKDTANKTTEDITENSTNINKCIPILLNLNNKDLSIITDIKKVSKKSRTQIEDILKKYKLKNKNIDFDINKYKLKNKYCITKNDVDDKGNSKYKYQKFIRYHTQKIKYTTKKCSPNEYIIYIITDDINMWNAKAGDSIIIYKNDEI